VRKSFLLTLFSCAWAVSVLGSARQLSAQLNFAPDSSPGHATVEFQPLSPLAYSSSAATLPDPPDPSFAGREAPFTPPGMQEHFGFLSRFAIGSGISPGGIGVKGVVVLGEPFDARVDSSWFFYNTGHIKVNGFDVNGDFHLGTLGGSLDWYPTKSVWRLSPGFLFYDGTRISADINLTGGTQITIDGKEYYSATENPVTGATPLTGKADLGLHSHTPAFTATGGFGKFIPRSHRHWSFPSEFGVAFSGPPTIKVAVSGWVCTDKKQTQCSNVADTSTPVGKAFNDSLQSALTKWRHNLDVVHVYPIFRFSFMYSFDLPAGR
jgi:hypothetical protein